MAEELINLKEKLNELKSKVKNNDFTLNDFKNFKEELKKINNEFFSLTEWAASVKKDDKEFQNLLRQYSLGNVSDLMDDIKRYGYVIQNDLGEDFAKVGYRLLEQIRTGKRSDVMYGISRIFITHQRNLRDCLVEAFKPYYDDETFKCLLYAFLSAAIKPEKKQEEV